MVSSIGDGGGDDAAANGGGREWVVAGCACGVGMVLVVCDCGGMCCVCGEEIEADDEAVLEETVAVAVEGMAIVVGESAVGERIVAVVVVDVAAAATVVVAGAATGTVVAMVGVMVDAGVLVAAVEVQASAGVDGDELVVVAGAEGGLDMAGVGCVRMVDGDGDMGGEGRAERSEMGRRAARSKWWLRNSFQANSGDDAARLRRRRRRSCSAATCDPILVLSAKTGRITPYHCACHCTHSPLRAVSLYTWLVQPASSFFLFTVICCNVARSKKI